MKKLVLIILICSAVLSIPVPAGEAQYSPELLTDGGISAETTYKTLTASGRLGTKGRLVIGDFSVALYESEGPDAQRIVDAADSACWFMWYGSQSPIIADHCVQGFDIIKDCEVGDTCYIVDVNGFQRYTCVAVDLNGVNERYHMYLSSGYDFMCENDPGFLYMYTCGKEGDPYHIAVAVWEKTSESYLVCAK